MNGDEGLKFGDGDRGNKGEPGIGMLVTVTTEGPIAAL